MEVRCPLVGKQEQPQQPPPTSAAEDRRAAFVKYNQQKRAGQNACNYYTETQCASNEPY